MINGVSLFYPSGISQSLPRVQSGSGAQSTNVIAFKPSSSSVIPPGASAFSFGDKLPATFSLSPSDFASVFGSNDNTSSPATLPHLASVAYSQSHLLTSSRLSLSA